jgi:predicted  nucleic acid-binding Zn-ribbon protein
MSWKCPACGTASNDDAATKCISCGNQFDEQEIDEAKVRDQLAEIEAGAANGTAGKAAVLLNQGRSLAEVTKELVHDGVTPEDASRIVNDVYGLRSQNQMAAARKTIISGAVLCAAGIAVTVVSYVAGFQIVVVAGGLFFAGAFQLVRGLREYTR